MSITKQLDHFASTGRVQQVSTHFSQMKFEKEEMNAIFGKNFTNDMIQEGQNTFTLFFEEGKSMYLCSIYINVLNQYMIESTLHPINQKICFYQKINEEHLQEMQNEYNELKPKLDALEKVLNHPAHRVKKLFL